MATATFFTNHYKPAGDQALLLIVKDIFSGKYRKQIEELRMLIAAGKTEEAETVKKRLPAFTPSGTFAGGRKADNLTQYSGFVHLDYDDIPPLQYASLFDAVKRIPYTSFAFRSPSGNGLKVFVEITSGPEYHAIAYAQVLKHYAAVTGLSPDPVCKDIPRLCYVSDDSEGYRNLTAEKFPVQLPTFAETPNGSAHHLDDIVRFTEQKFSYVNGNRNNFIHRLACNFNRRGIPEADALAFTLQRYDLGNDEITTVFRSAYNANKAEHGKYTSGIIPNDTNDDTDDINRNYLYSASQLLALDGNAQRYLLHPLLPATGTAVLVGRPDTGKSQFARQLTIAVSQGSRQFLGFDLSTTHSRALYVATEDDQLNTRFLVEQQYAGLQQASNDNLHFLFADTLSNDEILKAMATHLSSQPCDLVIVDSFGDIFKGSDTNSNMQMRNTVKDFDRIAKQFGCLILFVHHINKSAYGAAPAQQHIQGGAGLAQKVRAALQLTSGDGDKKYLTVTKGNYCPKEYKQNATELRFDETHFLFTPTGKLIPNGSLATDVRPGSNDTRYKELQEIAEQIFGQADTVLSYTAFTKAYEGATGKGIATAKRHHKQMLELLIIEACPQGYKLCSSTLPELED